LFHQSAGVRGADGDRRDTAKDIGFGWFQPIDLQVGGIAELATAVVPPATDSAALREAAGEKVDGDD
jgi:hypothetical protein